MPFAAKVISADERTVTKGKAKGKTLFRLTLDQAELNFIDIAPSRVENPNNLLNLVGRWIEVEKKWRITSKGTEYPELTFHKIATELNDLMSFNPTAAQASIISLIETKPTTSLVVDARAGAAKTSTIVLAAQKIGPQYSPLAVAFNKKIADELQSRLPSHFTCKTLNGLGHQAWSTRLGKRLQVDMDKMHKIAKAIDMGGEQDLFVTALTLARGAKSVGLIPTGAAMAPKGLVPDLGSSWDDIGTSKGILDVDDDAIHFARQILLTSIERAWKGEIDFDDQIYMSVLFGGTYPKYHTVIVDEAQDLSPLNHLQIVKLTGTRAIIVGDPYQAIYGFRGADSNSIENLVGELVSAGRTDWSSLPLSLSFRVPKQVSARQTNWVPDFGSMDFLNQGFVVNWPQDNPLRDGGPVDQTWSLNSIPSSGAVLCRNNAPLMRLAFAMIKQRRPVKILGRDIGASIASQLLKITGKNTTLNVSECWPLLEDWRKREIEKAGDSESKVDLINDRHEAIFVLLEAFEEMDGLKPEERTNQNAATFIRELFTDKADDYKTTFASIHRSKGLEWDWVMMLDPHRIPSQQAIKAQRNGDSGPMTQENNLRYVGETRTKRTLVLASLDDCKEVGE